jgi:PadR family transcriptional regulator PadR
MGHCGGGQIEARGTSLADQREWIAKLRSSEYGAVMEGHPAMREPTYYLLTTLLDGPLHGHGIIKRAKEISEGRVRLAAGTLYAALDRLSREGLIAAAREETVNGRLRQYYELTPRGTAAVNTEADRMARAARLVISRRTTSSVPAFPTPQLAMRCA